MRWKGFQGHSRMLRLYDDGVSAVPSSDTVSVDLMRRSRRSPSLLPAKETTLLTGLILQRIQTFSTFRHLVDVFAHDTDGLLDLGL